MGIPENKEKLDDIEECLQGKVIVQKVCTMISLEKKKRKMKVTPKPKNNSIHIYMI